MKDIDKLARELADRVHVAMIQTMQGNGDITAARNIGGAIISKALAAYGDEMAKQAVENLLPENIEAARFVVYIGDKMEVIYWPDDCDDKHTLLDAIRALPLPSEVTK